MSPTLLKLFQEYSQYHRDPVNAAIHKLAVPLIVFHVLAMLDWISLGLELGGHPITLAHAVFLPVLLWYLLMSARLAAVMIPFSALCLWVGRMTHSEVVIGIAVSAWIAQLIGHARFEGKAPAFKDNLVQLLVGPVYFIALSAGWWSPTRQESD
jgi:uncharacterized membrane protein YGL010W